MTSGSRAARLPHRCACGSHRPTCGRWVLAAAGHASKRWDVCTCISGPGQALHRFSAHPRRCHCCFVWMRAASAVRCLPCEPECPVLRPVCPCSAGCWQVPSMAHTKRTKTAFRHPPTIRLVGRTSRLPPTARQCPLTLCLPSTWWAQPCPSTATPFCWAARATAPPTQWSCCSNSSGPCRCALLNCSSCACCQDQGHRQQHGRRAVLASKDAASPFEPQPPTAELHAVWQGPGRGARQSSHSSCNPA